MLDDDRIAELLQPFLAGCPIQGREAALSGDFPMPGAPSGLPLPGWEPSPELESQFKTYLDLLLRWNARMNLTAVRDPEQIVTRHFGESLFAARVLHDAGALTPNTTLADLGSGAGFPGIPIKLFAPDVHLTLIESKNKKATFLREVVRALGMSHIVVHCGRAESWGQTAQVVTLRAVEKFAATLPLAAALVAPGGILALLISEAQTQTASDALGTGWAVGESRKIPGSGARVVCTAQRKIT